MKQSFSETTGVILLNLGGPDSLQSIRPFLYNLFSDRQIIPLGPPFLQKPLATLISTIRSKKTEKMYRLIGGKSPIKDITQAQAQALEEALNGHTAVAAQESKALDNRLSTVDNQLFKVYIAMRYWHPLIEDVIPGLYKDGIRKLIALSLYPQYSVATSGSSFARFTDVTAHYGIETVCIPSWHDHPLYIDALVEVIKKGLESFRQEAGPPLSSFTKSTSEDIGSYKNVHVLFSAHSLPKKIIDQGDPYVDQTMETIGEIARRISLIWHLSYQSRSGPVEWLGPSTGDKLEELARKGIKNVLVVPISFVSDHIETLYEIDILFKKSAEKLGMRLERTDSLNTRPKFIEALKDIVKASLQ